MSISVLLSSVAVRYLSCPTRYCVLMERGDVHHILTLAEGLLKVAPFVVWLRQILLSLRLNLPPRFTPAALGSLTTDNNQNNNHTQSYQGLDSTPMQRPSRP
jgi:hypothetical protein